ncbi:hypothetical protein RAL92_21815 [Metapseudomonas otitidis]|uniref:hypothetical protein n=1 Tax=Metapseudomonas otitidis TaxID=319939 RepID=UPI0032176598
MADFKRAIKVAEESVKDIVSGARDIKLEEALISSDGKLYEVTLSYEIGGGADLGAMFGGQGNPNMKALASLMMKRRENKVFLIDSSNFSFRGFRNYKES